MTPRLPLLALTALLTLALAAPAAPARYRTGTTGYRSYRSTSPSQIRSYAPRRTRPYAPKRIHTYRPPNTIRRPRRDIAERNRFRRLTGYPHGRPGYQVDHRLALCAGGPDTVSNMQWLSVAQHRAKTRSDIARCR